MPRAFYIALEYQNDEEVLETGVWYVDFGSLDAVNMIDMQTAAEEVYQEFEGSDLENLLPDGWFLFSVTVTTPKQNDDGPARHRYVNPKTLGNSGERIVFDSAVVNIKYSGTSGGEPVAGGQRVSGIAFSQLDCNVIDETWLANVEAEWLIAFPAVRQVNGNPWTRAVLHQPELGPDAFVVAPSASFSNRVGVRIDRVGNRPQRRKKAADPGDPT